MVSKKREMDQESVLVFVSDLILCLKYYIQSKKNKALGDVWSALFRMGSYAIFIPLKSVSVQ